MRNAKQILTAAIKEIEEGHWICGELCELPKGYSKNTAKATDFMGCAVGLVAIYGGDTVEQKLEIATEWETRWPGTPEQYQEPSKYMTVVAEVAQYPTVDSPKAVLKALQALAAATPKKWQARYATWGQEYPEDVLNVLAETVIQYNDQVIGALKTKKGRENQARKWFLNAIDQLGSVNGKLVSTSRTERVASLSEAF